MLILFGIIGGIVWRFQTFCAKRGYIAFPDSFWMQWYRSPVCERRIWLYLPKLDCSHV